MNELAGEIDYFITFSYVNKMESNKNNNLNLIVEIFGEKGETEKLKISEQFHVKQQDISFKTNNNNEKLSTYKLISGNIGKIKRLQITPDLLNGNKDTKINYYLNEIQLEIPYKNELFIFPIDKMLDDKSQAFVLEPNLKPGKVGVHYAITTHTDNKIATAKQKPKISIQIIGDKDSTQFIPLQHSQTNKQAFMSGKKDVFDVIAPDVGHIKKVILKNNDDIDSSNCWSFDSLEIRTISDGHFYNFNSIGKPLCGMDTIELKPLPNIELVYEVVLRLYEAEHMKKQTISSLYHHISDIYFQLKGSKGHTKKICLNNYELKKKDIDAQKEKYFEFKSEDIGKIENLVVSISEIGNPHDYLCIDYLEVKIPSRSEAYKFPVERAIGEYVEDGQCELELEVWKHPEKLHFIDYEVITESGPENRSDETGCCYLRIHGNHGETAKIKFIDIDSDENLSTDLCEFKAPDCGKINKIELFYEPKCPQAKWQVESIEVKVKSRNEAYRFPVDMWLTAKTSYLQLEPWRKPSMCQY